MSGNRSGGGHAGETYGCGTSPRGMSGKGCPLPNTAVSGCSLVRTLLVGQKSLDLQKRPSNRRVSARKVANLGAETGIRRKNPPSERVQLRLSASFCKNDRPSGVLGRTKMQMGSYGSGCGPDGCNYRTPAVVTERPQPLRLPHRNPLQGFSTMFELLAEHEVA